MTNKPYLVHILLSWFLFLEITSAVPGYGEHLLLRPLPNSALLASFNFRSSTPVASFEAQHFPLFPRSLGQILQHAHTKELHIRFKAGRWDAENWGERPHAGRSEGGAGVELWAWVEAQSDELAEARWLTLTNALSGLFCASLNFIDSTRTLKPVMTFQPEGDHHNTTSSNLHLLHGTLPGEAICTENLTPFLKLLPCKGKAGISSILDGHKIFDANWQAMAIDVRPVCQIVSKECLIEMKQSVDVVIDIERAKRSETGDHVPKPPLVESVNCDMAKYYHAFSDSCFPVLGPSSPAFSLSDIFGKPINGACPFSDPGAALVPHFCLDVRLERDVVVITAENHPERVIDGLRCFDIPEEEPFDITLGEQETLPKPSDKGNPIRVERTLTGYGQQRGGLRTVLWNSSPNENIGVYYFEPVPWFLRIYIHTIRAEVTTADGRRWQVDTNDLLRNTIYRPAIDRARSSHLELRLDIPAASTLTVTYDCEKSILRYSEYPPDANRGFNVPSSIVRVLGSSNDQSENRETLGYIRAASLLLYLPTPDFSMPYNVIILTSTVIALTFGTVFNLLIRRFVAANEAPSGGRLQNLIRQQIGWVKAKLAANKSKKE